MVPKCTRILGLFFIVVFLFAAMAFSEEAGMINLSVGESTVRGCSKDTWLVSVGNPNIADVKLKKMGQRKYVLITAKAPGVTNVVICKGNDCTEPFQLKVVEGIDLCNLVKKKLKEILPDEDIRVTRAGDSIILSGEVSSTTNISIAMELAEAIVAKKRILTGERRMLTEKDRLIWPRRGAGLYPTYPTEGATEERWERTEISGEVINLMHVGGVQQVMLEVRVAEMGRKLMRRLGFNFSYFSGPDFGVSLLNELTSFSPEEEVLTEFLGTPVKTAIAPLVAPTSRINALFRFHHGRASWTGFIDALKAEGIMKILAEPTLIALSGQEAEFLAGGEFPVPVPQPGLGYAMITIEWKRYGVELTFTPRVLSNDKISITVRPTVSELDYENALAIMGYLVPAVTTRTSKTTIELDDGQSFAIAGLLREDVYQDIEKFPVLGDIPVLGALFRSSEFRKRESELVIIVTPHLVKPLDMARQTLPTDQYVEPDDFEFYLLGALEGAPKEKKRPSALPKEEGLEGKFGHISP